MIPDHTPSPEPLRLAHVIDTLQTGGAERLIVTLAEAMKQHKNVDMRVLVLHDEPTPFREMLAATGMEIVPMNGRNLVDPLRLLRVVSYLLRARIEFVHAHLTSATVVGGIASIIARVPFATTIHNVRQSRRRTSRVRAMLDRFVLTRPGISRIAVGDAVAVASKDDTGGQPITIIPNAVPRSSVAPAGSRDRVRQELGIGPDETALMAVGAVIAQKAYPDLIDAFAIVAQRKPQARLFIAGGPAWPELMESLKVRVDEMGLSDRVTFLGLCGDIPGFLAAGDIFVSASHWEGSPVSLLEAMANGLPCVVTDVGDNRLVLDGIPAGIVPIERPEILGQEIISMMEDPVRQEACRAKMPQRALGDFGVEAWIRRLLDLYVTRTRRKSWYMDAAEGE